MNRMYQFYAFIPLVTFWFVCSYIIMTVYPRISAGTAKENPVHFFYIFIKLGAFLGFVIGLSNSEAFFEKIFMGKLWKYLFVNNDDMIGEWRQRWNLDAYSFITGMFFGLFLSVLKRLNIIDDSDEIQIELEESSTELRDKLREKNLPRHVKLGLILVSVTGIVSYATFANLCQSREGCNAYISYITIIPVTKSFKLLLFKIVSFLNDINIFLLDHVFYTT